MDQALARLFATRPGDHSLDGLPLSAMILFCAGILLVTVVLRLSGRSWRTWYRPANSVFLVWFSGIFLGHYGFESGAGKLGVIVGLGALTEPAVRLFRAALQPKT